MPDGTASSSAPRPVGQRQIPQRNGSESATESAGIQSQKRGSRRPRRSASAPARSEPSTAAPGLTMPKEKPTSAYDQPWTRTNSVGIQKPKPVPANDANPAPTASQRNEASDQSRRNTSPAPCVAAATGARSKAPR